MNIIEFKKDLDTFSNLEILSLAKMYSLNDSITNLRWLIAIQHASKQQMPNVIDTINRYFPNAEIDVVDEKYNVTVKCVEYTDTEIEFTILTDEIYLSSLYKCNYKSGTENLNNIINIAKDLGSLQVSLVDASALYYGGDPNITNCDISLSTIYILLYGQSWYNKFGFKSVNYNEEIKHNEKIRQMSLVNFLEKLLPIIRENLETAKLTMFAPSTARSEILRARQDANRQEQQKNILSKYGTRENYVNHVQDEATEQINAFKSRVMAIADKINMDPKQITVSTFAKYIYDNYINNKLDNCEVEYVQFVREFNKWASTLLKYNSGLFLVLN